MRCAGLSTQTIILVVGLWLGAAGTASANPAHYVPAGADAAVGIHLEQLLRHPSLTFLKDSGEIGEITDLLQLTELHTTGGSYPDVVMVFFGTRSRVLLTTAPEYRQLEERLRKKYGNAKNVTIDTGSIAGHPAVKLIIRSSRSNRIWRVCEVAYLAPDVVAVGSKHNPLPQQALGGQSAMDELLQGPALVSGRVMNPSAFRLDPLGIAARLRRIDFQAASAGASLALAARGQTTPGAGPAMEMMVQNLSRILLVSFFGSDPALYRKVAATVHTGQRDSEVTLQAVWSGELIAEINRFYAGNQEKFKQSLHATP